ncbi:MAG: response regulator [Gaiellaceae bacterium]
MTRLLLCDDAAAAREALRALLEGHPQIEIVGEAANGAQAISLALELEPDVILMDVVMPVLDGVEATRRLRQLLPSVRVVAFAGSDERETVAAMTEAGASAYCVKGVALWELERAITARHDPFVGLAHALARTTDASAAADLVANELGVLLGGAICATYLTTDAGALELAGLTDTAPHAFPAAPTIVVRALAARDLVHATPHELRELAAAGADLSEAVAVPLLSDGSALGVLLVAGTGLDVRQVATIADLTAATIANHHRLASTHAEARRDALTGLLNRRAFDERLARALRETAEAGGELAIALVDLDDFKQINDRDGHLVGDEVLCEVARGVLRTLRPDEHAFRVGGEEVAILIGGGTDAAVHVAERVRDELRGQRRGHKLPTVSIGIAAFPLDGRSGEELLQRADVALYAAKAAGKDRAVVYDASLDSTLSAPPGSRWTAASPARDAGPISILLVDDDPGLRALLRTTLETVDAEVTEADSAAAAAARLAAGRPDVVVLDVQMPGLDGLSFCRELRRQPATAGTAVIVLSGADDVDDDRAVAAGANAFLRKPFSPLQLLALVDEVSGRGGGNAVGASAASAPQEQLLLYAHDLRRLHDLELGQRALLQRAYRQTVAALAGALESKDVGTGAHSQRVRRYSIELAAAVDAALLDDPSVEYGFLLHDVGKIGIPDSILQKPGPLAPAERRVMQTHTVLGEQMLGGVALLQGGGLQIVRSHHERWDGLGYPDALKGTEIPLGARIFAVADALDAITSDRPYRAARGWDEAVAAICAEAGGQFDPDVLEAFREREDALRRIHAQAQTAGSLAVTA